MHPENTQVIQNPVVTAIILNYRDAACSLACIQSVLAEGVEHVIVWDNSEDGGVSAAGIQKNNPDKERVHIEISGRNLGFAAGVNRAIEVALHRWPETWVLLLNNDAILLTGGLEIMREALRKNVGTKLAVPRINHAGVTRGKIYYQRWTGLLFESHKPGCFSYPCGCCFMAATERLRLPLFDERFFMYGEDCELGYRLSNPCDILYLDEVLADHEGSASSGLGSEFYEDRIVASHFLMIEVLTNSKFQFFAYIVGRFFALSIRMVVRIIRYRSLIPLRSLWRGAWLAFGRK